MSAHHELPGKVLILEIVEVGRGDLAVEVVLVRAELADDAIDHSPLLLRHSGRAASRARAELERVWNVWIYVSSYL